MDYIEKIYEKMRKHSMYATGLLDKTRPVAQEDILFLKYLPEKNLKAIYAEESLYSNKRDVTDFRKACDFKGHLCFTPYIEEYGGVLSLVLTYNGVITYCPPGYFVLRTCTDATFFESPYILTDSVIDGTLLYMNMISTCIYSEVFRDMLVDNPEIADEFISRCCSREDVICPVRFKNLYAMIEEVPAITMQPNVIRTFATEYSKSSDIVRFSYTKDHQVSAYVCSDNMLRKYTIKLPDNARAINNIRSVAYTVFLLNMVGFVVSITNCKNWNASLQGFPKLSQESVLFEGVISLSDSRYGL